MTKKKKTDETKRKYEQKQSISQRLIRLYWGIVTVICMEMINYTPVFTADTIWSRFSTIMKDIYDWHYPIGAFHGAEGGSC